MDAEQEDYSEEEKNLDVSCNSEECHDIGQKTMVCLCFLIFFSPGKVARLTPFWFLGNGCRTRGVFRGRERRWGLLQLRGVPGYCTKNNGMSLFSTFLLYRKVSEVNSFLLVFREWMQNKRSIPRKRSMLAFPATPRSARILDKRLWYVFVFYFCTFQRR